MTEGPTPLLRVKLLLSSAACAFAALSISWISSAQAVGPPIVESTWVTDVTATSANLHARINPNGLPATYRFEYTTEAAWEANGFTGAALAPPSGAGALGGGSEALTVTQHLASLAPTTSYRYRVRASNGTVVFGA